MARFHNGETSIHYEEHGRGFPLLLIAPGAMNSTVEMWAAAAINPLAVYAEDFRLIAMDQRNAGRAMGPLDVADPWGSFASDQLVLPGVDAYHPTATGREIAALAPRGEVFEPWRDTPEHVEQAVEAVRRFLRTHTPG